MPHNFDWGLGAADPGGHRTSAGPASAGPGRSDRAAFIARTCPLCRKRRLPRDPLREVAVGRQRLGVNLMSLIVALREEGRLPIRTIQWYLQTAHQLKLSVDAVVRICRQVARWDPTGRS